jgi:hypothetical protein
MNKVGQFLQTRLGALVLWVVVMYLVAALWNFIDEDAWYAFPSEVIAVLAWIGSFAYMLASFLEWNGSRIQLKGLSAGPSTVSPPADPDTSDV